MAITVGPGATKLLTLALTNGSNIAADIGADAKLMIKTGPTTWGDFAGAWTGTLIASNVAPLTAASFAFSVVMPFPQADTEYAFAFQASIKPAGSPASSWAVSIAWTVVGESIIVDVVLTVLFVSAVWS